MIRKLLCCTSIACNVSNAIALSSLMSVTFEYPYFLPIMATRTGNYAHYIKKSGNYATTQTNIAFIDDNRLARRDRALWFIKMKRIATEALPQQVGRDDEYGLKAERFQLAVGLIQ